MGFHVGSPYGECGGWWPSIKSQEALGWLRIEAMSHMNASTGYEPHDTKGADRSALAAITPHRFDRKAAVMHVRLIAFDINRRYHIVDFVRHRLVAAARSVFVKYEVVENVPPPPQWQDW